MRRTDDPRSRARPDHPRRDHRLATSRRARARRDQRGQHRPLERDLVGRLAANPRPPPGPARAAALRGRALFRAAEASGRPRAPAWPLSLTARGMIEMRLAAIANSPGCRHVPAGCSQIVEAIDELTFGHRLAAPGARAGGQTRGEHAVPFAGQAGINQPWEGDVEVDAGDGGEDRGNREHDRQEAHPFAAPDLRDPNVQL